MEIYSPGQETVTTIETAAQKSAYKPNKYGWGVWDGWNDRVRREVKLVKAEGISDEVYKQYERKNG